MTDANGRVHTEEIRRFWRHLFSKERGFLCTASAHRNGDRLTDVRQEFYRYPAGDRAAAAHSVGESRRGREVYYASHLLKEGTERRKANAALIRCLWADLDGAPVPEHPRPTALLETSPGRWQAYWRLTRAITPEQAEQLNRLLTYSIGADKGKWALATLLRPPHTTNHKREEPWQVRLVNLDAGLEYNPDELDRLLRPAENANGHARSSSDPRAAEPPVRLGASGLRVWRGEQPKHKPTGEIDRSASLYKIGAVLARAGATGRAIAETLEERDETLGWNKYTGRPDNGQYAAIAAKIIGEDGPGPPSEGGAQDEPDRDVASFNLTDLGNAQRLVARHGADLRYCYLWGRWLCWDGRRWAVDTSGEVERRAVETVASIYVEAANATDKDERKALGRHADRSESRARIEAMIALARSRPTVPVMPDELDADPWLLNVENGTIDLLTGKLRRHRREDLITKLAPVDYDPDAEAPIFEGFLQRILPSEAVRSFLQRAVGYAATGIIREEVLSILHGPGANGKTTLTGVLLEALGDYAIQAAPDLLMLKRGAHPTELADLFGARLVVCMESEEGRRLAESLVKHITGRDRIRARRMREDFWEFSPSHTVFLGTNHRPEVRGTDHAIWRRLKLIPFHVTIPEAEQDKELSEKLRDELPGVLRWTVEGCIQYQRDGLGVPEQVTDATTGYRAEMDTLAAFFEDHCVIHPKAEAPATPLFRAYQQWCTESGEASESQRRFGGRLRERGFESFTHTSGPHRDRKGWRGIGLRDDRHDDDPGGGEGPPGSSAQVADQARTADERNRTSDSAHVQVTHNAGIPGADGPHRGQTADDRPHGVFPIDIGKTPEVADDADKRGPKIDIDSSNPPRGTIISKKGQNRPSRPKESAFWTQPESLNALDVAAELGRTGSGPAKALAYYLVQPSDTRLGYVTRAVLVARGMDTAAADTYCSLVEEVAGDPSNHPPDCECEVCGGWPPSTRRRPRAGR